MAKITFEEEKNIFDYTGVVGKAFLEYRVGVNDHCAAYDPFGLCNIMQCLYCDNCYYKITMENGEAITNADDDLNSIIVNSRGFDDDCHEILFYDYVPKIEDLYGYLFDENSEFKILRTSDNRVMNDYVKSKKTMIKKI